MQQLIGQHIMIGLSGHSLTHDEKKFIVENNISGVTLFGRNVQSPKQIADLCSDLQALRFDMPDKAPLFIAIDMEGGRVARLKSPFTQWPAALKLGALDSPMMSFNMALAMGKELRAVGINVDFAPCVDVFSNPQNPVIGDRALSADPEIVAKHATALIRGYMKAGIIPCAKHFPGHGNTKIDSHLDLPVEDADLQRLHDCELIPFKKAFRARLPMVMSAHILFKNIDPNWPGTLSEFFLKKLLREELRFRGLIVTDDLGMKAMSAHYGADQIPVRSLQAGADILLYCNEPHSPPIAIQAISKALNDGTLSKEQMQKSKARILDEKFSLLKNPEPMSDELIAEVVGCELHQKISKGIAEGIVPSGLTESTES